MTFVKKKAAQYFIHILKKLIELKAEMGGILRCMIFMPGKFVEEIQKNKILT